MAESKRISAGFLILTISARRTVARGISASLPRRWSASEPSIMKVPKNTRSGRIWIWTWTIGGTIYRRSTRNLTKMDCMQRCWNSMRIILMTSAAISNSPSAAACLLLPTSVFGTGDIKGTGKKPMPTFRTVLTTDMTARSGMLTGTVNSAEVRRTTTEQITMFTAKSRTARQTMILTIWKQSSITVLPRRRTSTV